MRNAWWAAGLAAVGVVAGRVGAASAQTTGGVIHGRVGDGAQVGPGRAAGVDRSEERPGAGGAGRPRGAARCAGRHERDLIGGPAGPTGATGPAGASAATSVQYRSAQASGLARALCQPGERVMGGGGFVEDTSGAGFVEKNLRQSYPISDASGVAASGSSGWQVTSSDFSGTVAAFMVCASP